MALVARGRYLDVARNRLEETIIAILTTKTGVSQLGCLELYPAINLRQRINLRTLQSLMDYTNTKCTLVHQNTQYP